MDPRSDELERNLRTYTAPGRFFDPMPDGRVRCWSCGHQCTIPAGASGICRMRFNEDGVLKVPFGYVIALNPDPVEKKPLYHVLPGSRAMSFGMLGCNFCCDFCQNWDISQVFKDPEAFGTPRSITAESLVRSALQGRCRVVCSTYNEPLITAEWGAAVFERAKAAGLRTAIVSNGFASERVTEALRPVLDCFKIDLKSFREKPYRELGGRLQIVTESIRRAFTAGYWVEIVTLVVPGFNDDPGELREMADFIRSVSPDIPWHVTAFHGQYRRTDASPTTSDQLMNAAAAGRAAGLHYVYAGNLPGGVGDFEHTACPCCRAILIRRHGFSVTENRVTPDGRCPDCAASIAGIWS